MSDKRYPTRMHEVLGVEAFEQFQIKGLIGHFFLTPAGQICSNEAGMDNNYLIDAVNHGIIRDELGFYDYYKDALDTVIAALRGPEWVRTADRLPEAADGITGATGEPEVLTICEHAHGWFPEVIRVSKVVRMPKYYRYWMPMPEPPKEESDE